MINNQNSNLSDIFKALSTADKDEKERLAKQMMQKLDKDDSRTLNEIMSDKNKLQQIISSDAARELMNKLSRHKNG